MKLDVVETLCELVALPSVNPMGKAVTGPEYFEHQVTEYLARLFERLGLPHVRQPVEPLRDNIIARLDGPISAEHGAPILLLEAHQDTVPVTGMMIDPWTPVVRDGRVYGRGACDIKGGLAAMLAAVARLADERPAGMPTIIIAATVNEEHGFSGATALTKLWRENSSIIPRPPDAAVIAEPTLLNVVVAHKGTVRWRCHTRGRAAHSSQPERGDNAIFRMSRVLDLLQRYQREVAPTLAEHPLCGRPTLSVGMISGGLSVNTVPDRCTIEIDRRLVPGEAPAPARQHVVDYLTAALGADYPVEHDPPYLAGPGLSDQHNGPLGQRLSATAREYLGRCETIGVPYGTNASVIAAAGVPAVVFGPGSIDQAHTADEWLAIDQLVAASEVYYHFARRGWTESLTSALRD